jgi:hypothetical protein
MIFTKQQRAYNKARLYLYIAKAFMFFKMNGAGKYFINKNLSSLLVLLKLKIKATEERNEALLEET